MAESDDKAKVEAALSKEVEEPKAPAETEETAPDQSPSTDEQTSASAGETTETSEEEVPESQDSTSTFTKPQGYEWVKGDTEEEFRTNLITAYENSTKEALRLRQQTQAPATPPASTETPQFDVNTIPEIQMLRAEQQQKMVDAFDGFAKKYPQAREPQSFDQFEKASQGASQAFVAAFNRIPTYPELFEKTAQLLDWQPSDQTARKDAAIKDAASSTGTAPATSPPPKPSAFNSKQLEIARRIPGNADKPDADLMKELAEAVAA